MASGNVIGQTLDNKYKIEKELGKGGMGTVYLATHVGTERPVAVKVIASEFMQRAEFIERFRREARAAGRLRHPNVVNVTDFGFSQTNDGAAAYLVMEYLDGCTLGEILEEEKHLALSWTIDILEQVCSAVEEAHKQGIIHRDLKPDNIWLEPNQRGGYTVKVLDFGIAKLEEHINDAADSELIDILIAPNRTFASKTTVADQLQSGTIAENRNATMISESATVALNNQFKKLDSESATLVQPLEDVDLESGTMILPAVKTGTVLLEEADNTGTKIIPRDDNKATKLISEQIDTGKSLTDSPATAELTRVGAVLGTPLYMSPEQCRGEKLSPRSDIYSLGVIAHQMLSGKTPFGGNYKEVMNAHQETAPPELEAKKVPRKVKKIIRAALAKNPEERPRTAESFASGLRAQSAGIGVLLQHALVIYTEHLPKFLGLAVLLFSPVAIITILQVTFNVLLIGNNSVDLTGKIVIGVLGLASAFSSFFCAYLLVGTVTWLVTQILAFPLRPVSLRPALAATRRKWKFLAKTGFLSTFLTFLGLLACFIGFPILSVLFALVAPVVMMENLRGFAALKRSKTLVTRSLRTTTAAVIIMFIIPIAISGLIAFVVNVTFKSISYKDANAAVVRQEAKKAAENTKDNAQNSNTVVKTDDDKQTINIGLDKSITVTENGESNDMGKRLRSTVQQGLTQILLLPFSIILGSFSSIVSALLYMKTRQVGGESMQDLLAHFEENENKRSNWQKRIRQRIEQSGKQTSRS
jgi:serine/threonine protein kinase